MTTRHPLRRLGRIGVFGAAAATLLATACQPVVGSKVAVRQTPKAPQIWDISDPAVFTEGTTSYMFGSTNNMNVPVKKFDPDTATLANTQHVVTEAMPNKPAWAVASQNIWAPTVIKIGSTYTMYFAAVHKNSPTDPNNNRCIGKATATSVMGPYTPGPTPAYCGLPRETGSNPWGRGAIDPEAFQAPDGKRYLLVTLSRTTQNIGIVRIDGAGGISGGVNATPTILASQSLPYHDGTDNSTRTGHVFLENPSMVYDSASKTYLLFYSAGEWYSRNYVTGFARCAAPTGPCSLDDRGPFLKGNTVRSAPGGLTVFKDKAGKLRAAYSTWKYGSENVPDRTGALSRQASIARLTVSGSDPATQVVRLDP